MADHRLQINGSVYHMNWNDVQTAFYNPPVFGNTTFGVNGPNYHHQGLRAAAGGKSHRRADGAGIELVEQRQSDQLALPDRSTTRRCRALRRSASASPSSQKGIGVVPLLNPFGAVNTTAGVLAAPSVQPAGPLRLDHQRLQGVVMAGANHVGAHVQPARRLHGRQHGSPSRRPPSCGMTSRATRPTMQRSASRRTTGPRRLYGNEPQQLGRQHVHLLGAVHQGGSAAASAGARRQDRLQILGPEKANDPKQPALVGCRRIQGGQRCPPFLSPEYDGLHRLRSDPFTGRAGSSPRPGAAQERTVRRGPTCCRGARRSGARKPRRALSDRAEPAIPEQNPRGARDARAPRAACIRGSAASTRSAAIATWPCAMRRGRSMPSCAA